MHLLEWLDGTTRLDPSTLAQKFNLDSDVAKAIIILRNEVSHNHHDPSRGTDLLTVVGKACDAFERGAIDITALGLGNREIGLLNYLFSLIGKLILDCIGASVPPSKYIPGFGKFEI